MDNSENEVLKLKKEKKGKNIVIILLNIKLLDYIFHQIFLMMYIIF